MSSGTIFSFFGIPSITSQQLIGENYLSWFALVEHWFLVQGFHDQLEDPNDIKFNVEERATGWMIGGQEYKGLYYLGLAHMYLLFHLHILNSYLKTKDILIIQI